MAFQVIFWLTFVLFVCLWQMFNFSFFLLSCRWGPVGYYVTMTEFKEWWGDPFYTGVRGRLFLVDDDVFFDLFESKIRCASGSGSSPIKMISFLKWKTRLIVSHIFLGGFDCYVISLLPLQSRHDLYMQIRALVTLWAIVALKQKRDICITWMWTILANVRMIRISMSMVMRQGGRGQGCPLER